MHIRKQILLGAMLLQSVCLTAQNNTTNYPKDYFRNPLDIPILLAGNFGECRPNHFHSGIDIKTEGKENLPVHAAADGYISRIKLESGGFGHAIYITHPNGYTTLYAHLNNFMPKLQDYVKQEQYKNESWQSDINFQPDQFPVMKGDLIAWSGNTGASTAPHLHFEIRNTQTEHPLNPLLFGMPVTDNIAPKMKRIAIYDMKRPLWDQVPQIITLQKKGDIYTTTTDTVVSLTDQAGIAIEADDYMNGSDNTLTYYTATLFMNDAQIINIRLDNIGYDETRYMHAFIDYKLKKEKNAWFQCLFQVEGNYLNSIYEYVSEYRKQAEKGKLAFPANSSKNIRVELTDAQGNKTLLSFYMKYKTPVDYPETTCDVKHHFPVAKSNYFSTTNFAFVLPEKSLYEHICFNYKKTPDMNSYSDRYEIGKSYTPIHKYFDLLIKADKPVPFNLRDKIAMVYHDGKDETGKAAIADDDWYKASFREFGEYRLVADDVPPVIKSMQKEGANLSKATKLSFTVKEAITSVKKFRAELDGKWLCFEKRGDVYFYTFDEHCPAGKHTLVVTAADENDNQQTLTYHFTR